MTEPMVGFDQQANDRILLQEAQRRQDLIDQAVKSFAPSLANTPGLQVIHLYSCNAALRKTIRDTFEGSRTIVVEHVVGDGKDRKGVNEVQHGGVQIPLPKSADLVVTKSNLNTRTELLAAQLRALPVVLPEGLDYLHKRLERATVLVLVGADQAK